MWHFVDLRLADQIFLWFPDSKLPQVRRLRHAYWTFERGTSVASIYLPAISWSNAYERHWSPPLNLSMLSFQSYNIPFLSLLSFLLHYRSYLPFHPTRNPPHSTPNLIVCPSIIHFSSRPLFPPIMCPTPCFKPCRYSRGSVHAP
jgi:hypothetical protein